jgi:hypothetical protein
VSLSSCDSEVHLWVNANLSFGGNVPDPVETFLSTFEDLMEPTAAASWRKEREAAQKVKEAEEEKQRKAEEEKRKREAEEKSAREEEEAEELTLQYVVWSTGYESDIAKKGKMLTTFPHLPMKICKCADASCKIRKEEEGSLRACQHDVEQLLRASGMYSLAWLRKERLTWHPDRFGQRCDIDYRKELKRKATELYAIYELLIEQEKAQEEGSGE